VNEPVGILPLEGPAWSRRLSHPVHVPVLGAVAGLATAVATVRSPQLGCAVALVLVAVIAYAASPAAGVTALTLTWLLAPGIRRVLGWEAGQLSHDPLSVAPFVATAAVAVMAAYRVPVPARVLAVPAAAAGGLLIGMAVGLRAPNAAIYGLVAYGGALSAFVVGWSDADRPLARCQMLRVVWLAAPALALYALYQYFAGLPAWDQAWLDNVDFTSIGAPEEGKIRAFASLNAPGLLGIVLALAILVHAGRPGLLRAAPAMVVVAAGLAVTYVRGAWGALVIGALVVLLASRGRDAVRVGRLAVLLGAAVLVLSASSGTYSAFLGRVETFGTLGADQSAQARTALPTSLLPQLVHQPLGYGLGTAGEASRLAAGDALEAPDNGYLAMAYQLGFAGALLVIGALLTAMAVAARRLQRARDPDAGLVLGLFAFFVVALALGDQFYGFAGVLLWYTVGAGLARALRPAPSVSGA
jgi:O-antigen ligase